MDADRTRRIASRDASRSDMTADVVADDPGVAGPRVGRPSSWADGGPADRDDADHDDEHDDGPVGPALRVLGWALAVAVSIALVRVLLVQSFVIPSTSMEPLLEPGDRVVVSRLGAVVGTVQRGDVVVFDGRGVFEPAAPPASSPVAAAGRAVAAAFGAPVGESDYVKRVVGLPGDRVVCCDAAGRVSVNGAALDEPYVAAGDVPSDVPFDIRVPAGRLFVLGDHRSESGDSRSHLGDPGGGTVPVDRVVGRVVAVWWPFERVGGVPRSGAGAAAPTVPAPPATAAGTS